MRVRSSSVKPVSTEEVEAEGVDVLFLVWLLARSTTDLLDGRLEPAGLTSDEFGVYSILAATGGITPTELARWIAAPPTTVSSYVKRLERRGHVTRRDNPDDRRSYLITLTSAGQRAHTDARQRFRPVRDQVETALAERQSQTRQTLLDLREIIDHLRASDSGPDR